METKMWNGSYYLSLWDTQTDKKNPDHVHAFQLDGEWLARSSGLQGIFLPYRVKRTLETIRQVCMAPYGAVDFSRADGSPLKPGEWPMIGYTEPNHSYTIAVLMLAMNYMYAGEQEFGLELAETFWKGIICEGGMAWDMPAEINAATGKRFGGSDYYHNMLLWSLPAAMEGEAVDAPCKPGGLVARILKAATLPGN
ncbi:MAG: hypothetical protein A2Z18_01830 [Armatimonadetes bacterium RBG_16_58_9]|nr:MAG: hypothetical protein A2Z18_01830 [Armatimonadetes bacterium RBG_16_58_9]